MFDTGTMIRLSLLFLTQKTWFGPLALQPDFSKCFNLAFFRVLFSSILLVIFNRMSHAMASRVCITCHCIPLGAEQLWPEALGWKAEGPRFDPLRPFFLFKNCGLWTVSCDFAYTIHETLKWLTQLPILMQSFWW